MVHRDDRRRPAARDDVFGGGQLRAPLAPDERIDDALIALAARVSELASAPPSAGDGAFDHDGAGVAADESYDEPAPWSEARVRAVAKRVRACAMAERMPLRAVERLPEERPASASALAVAVERAAEHGCAPMLDLAAAAGAGRELWDAECESWVELPSDLPRARYVALRVSGESMAPLMHSGDLVLVQLGTPLARDTVIVARRPGEGYVVKRVGRLRRTTIELLSLNPDFPPIIIPRDERLIVGKVVMRWSDQG